MNCDSVQGMLDEYVDGGLPLVDREEVDAHLATCERCAAEVAGIRALLTRVEVLPKSAMPARDLWPAIASGRGAPAPSKPARQHPRWQVRGWSAWMAAAAALLVVLSSAMTWLATRHAPDASVPEAGAEVASQRAIAQLEALDVQYGPPAAELAALLDTQRSMLAPRTVATVETNLRIIDQAIRESRAALMRDPGNRALLDMLASTYRQKVDLLKRTTELSRES